MRARSGRLSPNPFAAKGGKQSVSKGNSGISNTDTKYSSNIEADTNRDSLTNFFWPMQSSSSNKKRSQSKSKASLVDRRDSSQNGRDSQSTDLNHYLYGNPKMMSPVRDNHNSEA